jgi:hypothetical protein
MIGKFLNVNLEKDEGQLVGSCEKLRIIRIREERHILHTIKRRKANWIGHILCENCLLKQVTEEKIEGRSDGKTTKKTSAVIG